MGKRGFDQFIVLPTQGIRVRSTEAATGAFLRRLTVGRGPLRPFRLGGAPGMELRLLDSVSEYGAKLVEIAPAALSALRALQPGLRLVPLSFFHPAVTPPLRVETRAALAGAAAKVRLRIVSRADGTPVAGALVVAFTDFEQRIGAQGWTNAKGEVRLALGSASPRLKRLYVYPERNFWSALRKSITVTSDSRITLVPLSLDYTDSLRHFYGAAPAKAGRGIRVAVVDTGIAEHPDLDIDGGENTVVGEDSSEFGDNGRGHGTHVAGIIAARGRPPEGVRGLAPAVSLRSYRVFGRDSDSASNYAITKAIDRAVEDGCDLINLSLGGGPSDEAIESAIQHARSQGSLVIAAAGNERRQPVSFPASYSLSLAVSAMGRKGTYPPGTTHRGEVASPYGTDAENFVAAFSNVGPELDLTAPGVGIISTYPGGHAALDGTSMSCPAAVGAAAALLSTRPELLKLPRGSERSQAMARAVLGRAQTLGFGSLYEGQGLIR
ncbi:MAG: S8 family serine peptidase [Spirochaetales bacterium]|nr:S8 family serine peptidase [Spirochaetales bacterium]